MMRRAYGAALSTMLRHRVTAAPLERLASGLFKAHVHRIKRDYAGRIFEATGGIVQAGPFAGQTLLSEAAWGHDLIAMLLGEYEKEVVAAIEERLSASEVFYDVGCANGYFAVGAARACPHVPVVAFDIDAAAREATVKAARANGVLDRVTVRAAATPPNLIAELSGKRGLALIDIEGAELELLSPEVARALSGCDIIVENHEVNGRNSVDIVAERFRETHEVRIIPRQGRNPFASPVLNALIENNAWIAISEERAPNSYWVLFASMMRRTSL